jgi:hypothetical protein
MIKTNRITSGFDVELQLASGWFWTAIDLLIQAGEISAGNLPIIIQAVRISHDPNWDLEIDVPSPLGLLTFKAKATLSDDASELNLTFDNPLIESKTIPFNILSGLAGKPIITKLLGDDDHEDVLCVLANLRLQTNAQSDEPMTADEVAAQVRGNVADAQSFVPIAQHIAFGISEETFKRMANNIWHTQLRVEDGSHPLPDAENKMGDWKRVKMWGSDGSMKIEMRGEVPIDIWPDADVTITITITPFIENEGLKFKLETDSDVDTGILGDIFAFLGGGVLGGLIGLVVAVASGGLLLPAVLIGAGIGAIGAVVILEVGEAIAGAMINQRIDAVINGEPVGQLLCNEEGIVKIAIPKSESSFDISMFNAIPSSIPLYEEEPENELLYKQTLLVSSVYTEVRVTGNGFAATGTTKIAEKLTPHIISLKSVLYEGENLVSMTFERANGEEQTLTKAEVLARAQAGQLKAPFKLFIKPSEADMYIPEGKLACVCLTPLAIHQVETIVEEIEFEGGIRMRVPDIIELQDAAALVVVGYQLIHPRDYNSYYRAKADFYLDNNLESLPTY